MKSDGDDKARNRELNVFTIASFIGDYLNDEADKDKALAANTALSEMVRDSEAQEDEIVDTRFAMMKYARKAEAQGAEITRLKHANKITKQISALLSREYGDTYEGELPQALEQTFDLLDEWSKLYFGDEPK